MDRVADYAGTRPIWKGQKRDRNIAEARRANGMLAIYCSLDATNACTAVLRRAFEAALWSLAATLGSRRWESLRQF